MPSGKRSKSIRRRESDARRPRSLRRVGQAAELSPNLYTTVEHKGGAHPQLVLAAAEGGRLQLPRGGNARTRAAAKTAERRAERAKLRAALVAGGAP